MFSRLLIALSLVPIVVAADAAVVTLDSTKESFIRRSQAGTNQGQTRLIFGAQGGAGSEFRTMFQFSLDDLAVDTSGSPIIIDSVSLDSGDAFGWDGNANSNSFSVHAWDVTDFDVTDNFWNDPQGSAGTDIAGGTLGASLSTETFTNATPDGDFIFTSSAAFTSFLQDAYDTRTGGENLNFLVVTDNVRRATIPRTDEGAARGIGTADLVVNYTAVAIPEPASFAFLSIAGGALLARHRRKK